MVTADALSRLAPLDEFEVPDMKVKVHHLIRITPAKMQEFKDETAKDQTFCYPVRLCKVGRTVLRKLSQ